MGRGSTAQPSFCKAAAATTREPVRVGFTVTKKNGNAPERNRIRRRLREVVKRLDVISMRPHHDYVLVGRREALTRDFAAMVDDLRSALNRFDNSPIRAAAAAPDQNDETANPMNDNNRNTILAVILSGIVLIAWQYFYNVPQMEKQRVEAQKQAELVKPSPQATPGGTPGSAVPGSTAPGSASGSRPPAGRDDALDHAGDQPRPPW